MSEPTTFGAHPAPSAANPVAICVLGMHRSGTSALARLINLLGVDLGEDLLPGKVDNPKGFWEQRQILEAHTDLLDSLGSFFDDYLPLPDGWENRPELAPHRDRLLDLLRTNFAGKPLWGFKDPRTCRLLPLWHNLFATLGVGGRFALMVRNPDEIAKSLAVRNGYSYNKSLLLTLGHMLEAERYTRGRPRVVVTYDEVLADWRATAAKVGAALGVQWPVHFDAIATEISEFLDPNLRHHKSGKASDAAGAVHLRGADSNVAAWVFAVHDLMAAAKDGASIDEAAMDRVYAEFQTDLPRLSAWRQLRSVDQRFMQVEAWGLRLDATVKRLAKDNDELRLDLARRTAGLPLTPPPHAGTTSDALGADEGVVAPDAVIASLAATNRTLQIAADSAERDLQVFRDAVTQRDALISQLQTRERELDLGCKWLESEKAAADRELERRAEAVRLLQEDQKRLSGETVWLTEQKAEADRELERRAEAIRLSKEDHQRLAGEIEWLSRQKADADGELNRRAEAIRLLEQQGNQLAADLRWYAAQKAGADEDLARRIREAEGLAAEVKQLQSWNAELTTGRDWLVSENARLADWANKLEADKAWLEEQRESLSAELKARESAEARGRAPAVAGSGGGSVATS